jgi:hypothetical protein
MGRCKARAWEPSRRLGLLWHVLGTAMALAAIGGYQALYATGAGSAGGLTPVAQDALFAALGVVALLAVVAVLHEWVHGLTMQYFGVRPRYGAEMVAGVLPAFNCTADGYRFTRGQYALVALAPLLSLSALGALLVLVAPFGGWLVVPLGIHVGGTIGDLWVTVLSLRQPPDTLVEDRKAGVVFHYPSTCYP